MTNKDYSEATKGLVNFLGKVMNGMTTHVIPEFSALKHKKKTLKGSISSTNIFIFNGSYNFNMLSRASLNHEPICLYMNTVIKLRDSPTLFFKARKLKILFLPSLTSLVSLTYHSAYPLNMLSFESLAFKAADMET